MVGWVAYMISSRSKLFSSSTDFWGFVLSNQDPRAERSRKVISYSGARYSRLGARAHQCWPSEFSMA